MSENSQQSLMLFAPDTGEPRPYPSQANQWRIYHGNTAWLWNPWTGALRNAKDVGTDCFGYAVVPPEENT